MQKVHLNLFLCRFYLKITRLGMDFAAKYTGLQDTVSAQVSSVRISLNRATLAALLQYMMQILPAIKGYVVVVVVASLPCGGGRAGGAIYIRSCQR